MEVICRRCGETVTVKGSYDNLRLAKLQEHALAGWQSVALIPWEQESVDLCPTCFNRWKQQIRAAAAEFLLGD